MKKIAVLSDMSGFGRCSITVCLPIISAFQIQCCPMPTAILSSHTGFDDIYFDDYTISSKKYLQKWEKINLEFNAILTGFFSSSEQILSIFKFIEAKKDTLIIVDPVMGDDGKLYATYTDEMVKKVQKLCSKADVILPNLTEACMLAGVSYTAENFTTQGLIKISQKLQNLGAKQICITGIVQNDEILNFIYQDGAYEIVKSKIIGEIRSGTGDVFASVVTSCMVRGENLLNSVKNAVDYLSKTIEVSQKEPLQNGICFEKTLLDIGDYL